MGARMASVDGLAGVTAGRADTVRLAVRVTGIVQGVGYRPFVFRLAELLVLRGLVGNDQDGVFIQVEGRPHQVDDFVARLRSDAPPLAKVDGVVVQSMPVAPSERGFRIVASSSDHPATTARVSPDTATCDACLAETRDAADRRFGYPFTNCTNCGPRFTIVERVPYDRVNTAMRDFILCEECSAEYHDPRDRRFHAQPNACPVCGPRLRLIPGDGSAGVVVDDWAPIDSAARLIHDGHLVAVKGLGGFHLCCDATNAASVRRLRECKGRDAKALAIMVRDAEAAATVCELDPPALEWLMSHSRPIVLARRRGSPVDEQISPDNDMLGVMLPYTPLHHMLMDACITQAEAGRVVALVLTSANDTDEPMLYRDDEASRRLLPKVAALLTHDRPIINRCDDSVVLSRGGYTQAVRRARGLAPAPIPIPVQSPRPILACGPRTKNTFALAQNDQVIVSHHIGNLGLASALESYERSVSQYCLIFQVAPEVLAHDMHPGYESTQWALRQRLPRFPVQHHEAHIASVLAEHGVTTPVIGVAADGSGYGTDGTVWGGEVFVGDLGHFDRVAHLEPVPMPGGERAVVEPWRMASSYAWAALGDGFVDRRLPVVDLEQFDQWPVLQRMIERNVNSPGQPPQQRAASVAVLDARGGDHHAQQEPRYVDGNMPFPALDFLPRIVSAAGLADGVSALD